MEISQLKALLPAAAQLNAPALPFRHLGGGKVRELYKAGDALLMLASDRVSAFDVVLPNGVPGKGIVLTQLARWWFDHIVSDTRHHLVSDHDNKLAALLPGDAELRARCMLVEKLRPLPIEAVVRGFLSGSGWKEYRRSGSLWGQSTATGLGESEALPEPLFTPTTKSHEGHDEPVPYPALQPLLEREALSEQAESFWRDALGDAFAEEMPRLQRQLPALAQTSLTLYREAAAKAERAGLILADTKFEFGTDADAHLVLMDEIFTPDSSRYWPAEAYQPGRPQPSFDKQFIRDYLEALTWDKTAPGPELPTEVIQATQQKYLEAFERLKSST